jgi:hypothetical protein
VSRAEGRAESAVQALLTVAVGGVAGAAAWSHVMRLATVHGQPGWLAVADAAVIETLAVSAGLEIRRRRRNRQPVRTVVAVLVAAVALSLACQVATAEPSPWGWVMAAVPAAGFLAMAKIALGHPTGRTGAAVAPHTPTVTAADSPASRVPVPRTGTPARRRTGTGTPRRTGTRTDRRSDADLIAALADVPREPDGTVPVRRAAAALHCGPDRARRLLREAGLLKPAAPAEEPPATAAVAA